MTGHEHNQRKLHKQLSQLKPLSPIKVQWVDACSDDKWRDPETTMHPTNVISVGFFFDYGVDDGMHGFLTIVSGYAPGNGHSVGYFCIPVSCIDFITELK